MFTVQNSVIVVSEEQETSCLKAFRRVGHKLQTWLNSKSIIPVFGGQ